MTTPSSRDLEHPFSLPGWATIPVQPGAPGDPHSIGSGLGQRAGRTPPDARIASPHAPPPRPAQLHLDARDGGHPAACPAPRPGALMGLGGRHAFLHLYAGGQPGRAAFLRQRLHP